MYARLRRLLPSLLLAAGFLALAGCSTPPSEAPAKDAAAAPSPGGATTASPHVPGADCQSCHAPEADAWRGSHHALATAPIDVEAHRARFTGEALSGGDLRGRPLASAAGLSFEVTDQTGTRTFPVRYTLAVAPLQQYLLEGPGGRLYVAPFAWDVAGARWFDPSQEGGEGDPADPLYWAGLTGTWNHMCAECHTTRLVEGYDVASGTYTTTWEALGVACTACHGPAAENDLSRQATQIEVCGDCHSRREPLVPNHHERNLYDHAVLTLLDGGPTYSALGGIQPGEEAFELGGYLQSRMYAKGVKCTDCHDPHTGGTLQEGNLLCGTCHQAPMYDGPQHHGHTTVKDCKTCHMPTERYMGLHDRRDHHIRVPDPAAARLVGARDPCLDCHAEDGRLDGMAPRDQVATRFAAMVDGARRGDPSVLIPLQRALADQALGNFRRASAAALLRRYPPQPDPSGLLACARDPDALVRTACVTTLATLGVRRETLGVLLADPVRAVRFAAVRVPEDTDRWRKVRDEVAARQAHPDSPSTWVNLGVLRGMGGDLPGAEADLRRALQVHPGFEPARRNLAVVLAQQGRREEAERVLKGE